MQVVNILKRQRVLLMGRIEVMMVTIAQVGQQLAAAERSLHVATQHGAKMHLVGHGVVVYSDPEWPVEILRWLHRSAWRVGQRSFSRYWPQGWSG